MKAIVYIFPVYLTVFPDSSVLSRKPTLLIITLSEVLNAILHCLHLETDYGQSLVSSLCTRPYCLPVILSGFRISPSVEEQLGWFTCAREKKMYNKKIPENNPQRCMFSALTIKNSNHSFKNEENKF